MRTTQRTRLALCVLALAAAPLAACSSQDNVPDGEEDIVATDITPPAGETSAAPDPQDLQATPGTAKSVPFGCGNTDKPNGTLEVTLSKPAKATFEEGFVPEKGHRWLAVRLEVVNKTSARCEITVGLAPIGTDDQEYNSTLVDNSLGQSFPISAVIGPGQRRRGALTLEIGQNTELAAVQMTVTNSKSDMGMSAGPIEWKMS